MTWIALALYIIGAGQMAASLVEATGGFKGWRSGVCIWFWPVVCVWAFIWTILHEDQP